MIRTLVNDYITLFVALDPIGTVPFLVPLIRSYNKEKQRKIIISSVLIASGVLAGFAIFGHVLLATMGISFSSFRIAGGLVLFVVGAKMIFEDSHSAHKESASEEGHDPTVFPLAMPYLAGPATTLAVMIATQQSTFDPLILGAKIGVLGLVMASTMIILLSSSQIHKILGRTGSEIIGRVMGILLAALAAESVVRGIIEAFSLS